jgi:drug/metabolite transporter (DMT)-like permease
MAVQALFGSLPVIAKPILTVIPAISLVGFRVGITAGILVLVQAYRRRLWLAERRDYLRLFLLSFLGVTFNQLLFIGGLSFTKASNTSLLAATIPVVTILAGALLGTEKLRGTKIGGIAISIAGIVILVDPRHASFSSETTIGDLMIVLNSVSYGVYVALSKPVFTRNGAFRSMMWVFVFAAIFCVPLGGISYVSAADSPVTAATWAAIIHVAIAGTALPYLLNAWALARVDPSTVAIFIYLQPLIGFVLAAVFLGEALTAAFFLAAIFIFTGLFLATKRQLPRET